MSGPQHPFPPNFVGTAQNELRSQFGSFQRGQLGGMLSPSSLGGIANSQTYGVGLNIQASADCSISPQHLQTADLPMSQQIQQHQLHLQQRSQQQEDSQQNQQISTGQQQNLQQNVQSQLSSVPSQTNLQSHQQILGSPGSQNINTCIAAEHSSIQSVSQSSITSSGAVISAGVAISTPQRTPTSQQYNNASLCTYGQETVQEIVTKLEETFKILQAIPTPTGTPSITTNRSKDDKGKVIDYLRAVKGLFKRLRLIYDKVNDSSQFQGMEYMHIESLIPLKEEWDVKTFEERKTSEVYRLASEECKELIDQVIAKNAQLKEIIDRLRRIIWEINTMLMMRKS